MSEAIGKSAAVILKEKGNKLFENRKFVEAIAKYTEAIELDESEVIFYSNRSACYAQLGQWTKAADDGQRCMSMNENFAKGYFRFALALKALNNCVEAMQVVERGLVIDPLDANLRNLSEELVQYRLIKEQPSTSNLMHRDSMTQVLHPHNANLIKVIEAYECPHCQRSINEMVNNAVAEGGQQDKENITAMESRITKLNRENSVLRDMYFKSVKNNTMAAQNTKEGKYFCPNCSACVDSLVREVVQKFKSINASAHAAIGEQQKAEQTISELGSANSKLQSRNEQLASIIENKDKQILALQKIPNEELVREESKKCGKSEIKRKESDEKPNWFKEYASEQDKIITELRNKVGKLENNNAKLENDNAELRDKMDQQNLKIADLSDFVTELLKSDTADIQSIRRRRLIYAARKKVSGEWEQRAFFDWLNGQNRQEIIRSSKCSNDVLNFLCTDGGTSDGNYVAHDYLPKKLIACAITALNFGFNRTRFNEVYAIMFNGEDPESEAFPNLKSV